LVEQTLPFEVARAGVDLFFRENESRHIRFYGPGEPTQAMSLMKRIVEYAKCAANGDLTVELQTNGVFAKNDRDWLLNNINIMWISFDGEPKVHDIRRHFPDGSPTSPFIEQNVRWLLEKRTTQNFMIGARVTITEENIERQKSMVNYFLDLGIKYIWSDPVFPTVDAIPAYADVEKMEAYHFDMDRYVDTYIEATRYARDKGIFYGSFLTCNFDGKTNKHCRACTPVPHFTPDGYISACDLVTFGANPHHMDCFVYGKWNQATNGFDIYEDKKSALQNRTTDNMDHCQYCSAKDNCGGYCLGEVANETGQLLGQKPHTCKAIRRLLSILGTADVLYPYMHP
jgi:radical SAM protein with 4Fe4S-binding SPASM domain